MTDRELLELAAKAAGYNVSLEYYGPDRHGILEGRAITRRIWNPLQDDGDALRLAVKLNIKNGYTKNAPPELGIPRECGFAVVGDRWFAVENLRDPDAATRLAITRAAAEIGKMNSV